MGGAEEDGVSLEGPPLEPGCVAAWLVCPTPWSPSTLGKSLTTPGPWFPHTE